MGALNRHVERVFNPDRKDHHWAAESWRGIDDARVRVLQCRVVLFSSVMTSLMSGSSPSLHLHGIPAPTLATKFCIPSAIGVVFAHPPIRQNKSGSFYPSLTFF